MERLVIHVNRVRGGERTSLGLRADGLSRKQVNTTASLAASVPTVR